MNKDETTTYFDAISKEDIAKLVAVGFTEEQAEVLVNMMRAKAFSGGIF
jgi:hypothetical protein